MRGLYLITPDWNDTSRLLEITEQALQGGAAIVQYRHKTAASDLREKQATALLSLCRRYQRSLIINDDLALCLALDVDGVHVGVTDTHAAEVRETLGPDKIVGVSCYGDASLAYAAYLAGASYVAFGGFYWSRVKQYPVTTTTDVITRAKAEINLPIIVIGGMTPENAKPLIVAGADMVAAISSVYLSPHPLQTARDFTMLFDMTIAE